MRAERGIVCERTEGKNKGGRARASKKLEEGWRRRKTDDDDDDEGRGQWNLNIWI